METINNTKIATIRHFVNDTTILTRMLGGW